MQTPRFIQIHTLHTYPAALLNRDDAGLAKRLPLGDAVRTRISSQCLKRHWRVADDIHALERLDVPMAIRSRSLLELIKNRLLERGVSETLTVAAVEALRDAGLLDKGGKGKKGEDALKTGQAVMLGKAEIDYLVKNCEELINAGNTAESDLKSSIGEWLNGKNEKQNIASLKHGSGLESALFGRMVTSDVLTNRDAAVYVAHAFTVHQAQVENDYFTVVDDLGQESGELGSAGIFDTELASGLYYGYVVIDVPQLVQNLEGIDFKDCFASNTPPEKRELAGRVVEHLLHLIAKVSPGAKRGSTAPFDWAKFMLVEAGDWQPRSLAGAFHDALPLNDKSAPIRYRAVQKMIGDMGALDEAYGATTARRFLSVDQVDVKGAERLTLPQLSVWVKEAITNGEC